MFNGAFNPAKTIDIFKKELHFFLYSPVAYLFACLFLVASGWWFFSQFFIQQQMEMRIYFEALPVILAIAIPGITMTLLSDEFGKGSYEIINTTSVSTLDIVLGKFLAASAFMVVTLLLTLAFPISISFLGDLDWGPVIGGYASGILLILTLTAIGLFTSALTKYSIVALMLGWLISITLTFVMFILVRIAPPIAARFIEYISINYHFESIARGVIDFRSLLYFMSLSFLSVYATKLVLDFKK